MSNRDQEPIISNDAEIIILDETVGVIDTTRRPASEASRKAAQKYLEKEAEFRQLTGQIDQRESQRNATVAAPSIFDLFGKAEILRTGEDIAEQLREERDSWGEQ